jgi:hypothetical protein
MLRMTAQERMELWQGSMAAILLLMLVTAQSLLRRCLVRCGSAYSLRQLTLLLLVMSLLV